ncbi:MAG: fasciclin domain-containing protein [Brevundimonas sp.]|uniref:fasciclin domain-containing protein n=1 Tax=Brevundimonas sp. TaxID=1871086 RepID=UPI00391B3DF5
MRTFMIAGVSAAALLALSACNSGEDATETAMTEGAVAEQPATPAAGGTVVEVAQGNPEFSTLVEAVTAADLAGTLNGAGPFTVFAPTNAAFEKIPAADRQALMQPDQREALQGILTYHVVPGRLTAADIASQAQANNGAAELTTVQGGTLTLRESNGQWVITDENGNTSTIAMADVAASNGVIHAIDTVVMPN